MDATTITIERLNLRMFCPADLDAYAAMCADAEVMRHIGRGGAVGRDMAWGQLALFLGHWPLRDHGMWAIEHQGHLIGRAGFIHPEACRAALARGRRQFGAPQEVISLIRPGNGRSVAVAHRLGAMLAREIDFMGKAAQVYIPAPA